MSVQRRIRSKLALIFHQHFWQQNQVVMGVKAVIRKDLIEFFRILLLLTYLGALASATEPVKPMATGNATLAAVGAENEKLGAAASDYGVAKNLNPSENIGSAAEWVLALTAIATLVIARNQLLKMAESSSDQRDIARAQLLLEIDGRFESNEMNESRLAVKSLRSQCENAAKMRLRDGAHSKDQLEEARKEFSNKITQIYNKYKSSELINSDGSANVSEDGKLYQIFMRLPYWMETVGALTRSHLLPEEDVLNLYDAVFIGTLGCFDQHITDRREALPDQNDLWLENARWLRDQAVAREAQRKVKEQAARSNTRPGPF